MSDPDERANVSLERYFELEKNSPCRHEYYDGRIHAMSGSTRNHRRICGNIYSAIRAHLKGSDCEVNMYDARVSVEAINCVYYPDIVVECGKLNPSSINVANPVLIVEVLSGSTAATDRREKAYAYKKIPSLKEYAIVHQKFRRVELHRKRTQDNWVIFDKLAALEFQALPCGILSLSLEQIYEGVVNAKDWEVHEDPPQYSLEFLAQEGIYE